MALRAGFSEGLLIAMKGLPFSKSVRRADQIALCHWSGRLVGGEAAMQDQPSKDQPSKDQSSRPPEETETSSADEFSLESAGEVVVTHHAMPPGGPEKKTHPRRPLPSVPVNRLRPDEAEEKDK